MTDERGCGDDNSPDGEPSEPEPDPVTAGKPALDRHGAPPFGVPRLGVSCALPALAFDNEAIASWAAESLLADPGLYIVAGIALALLAGLAAEALQKFSPSLLRIRIEKSLPEGAATDARLEQLSEELAESDSYLPLVSVLKFCGVAISVLGMVALLDEGAGLWPAGWPGAALLLVLLVLFGEILPDRIAEHRAEAIVLRSLAFLRILRVLFVPLTVPLGAISRFVVRNVLGIRAEIEQQSDREHLADEIRAAVQDSDEAEELADEERRWIGNIVEFRDTDVANVMTPRTDIVAVEAGTRFRDAVKVAVDAGHSRLPVYENKLDNMLGVFYLRDAVGLMAREKANGEILESNVKDHVRPPYYVPESKEVADLLREFRTQRLQIAIVVDEYGGTAGLVSLEDIVEEIVGEIDDEYDPEREDPLRILEEGRLAEIDARCPVDELNEALGTHLPESEDYETVGGFLFSHIGRIPSAGEGVQHEGLELTVLSATARRIERLRIRVLEREPSPRSK